MKYDYSVQLFWSNEDKAYLAVVPELPGCMADGKTPEAALKNVRIIQAMWIDVATEEKRQIPKPMAAEDYEQYSLKLQQRKRLSIEKKVVRMAKELVGNVLKSEGEYLGKRRSAVQFIDREPIAATRR